MNKSIDWSEWILQKNSEAKQEELKKSDFVELNKSGGEDLKFEHIKHSHHAQTDESGARPIGPVDFHEFAVHDSTGRIGTATALHESDSIEPSEIEVKGRHKNEVRHALRRHLDKNYKKYMDMSPSYGKKQ